MQCWNEYNYLESLNEALSSYYDRPYSYLNLPGFNHSHVRYAAYKEVEHDCDGVIYLQVNEQDINDNMANKDEEGGKESKKDTRTKRTTKLRRVRLDLIKLMFY